MPKSLISSLPDFSKARLLVVGDVMLDRYFFGDTKRISPEAPIPIVTVTHRDHRPGGAGNVALNIASLGGKVTLLGITGNDEAAHILAQQLEAATVTPHFLMQDNLSTIIKLRVISQHQQLIRLDFEAPLEAIDPNQLLDKFQQALSQTDLVILSDYSKGTLSRPGAFIELARKANVPVLVDPKSTDFNVYQYATIVTPNFKEFEAVVGRCENEQTIYKKGQALLETHHFKALLITRGEDGMTWIEKNHTAHIPAYAREIFDVTGAGDTVIATLGLAIAAGLDGVQSATLANLAASLVVNKLGAATVTLPELTAALTGKTNFATGILNEEQLIRAVKEVQAQGKKVVFTNGCFDIIHAGHVASLQLAKQLGDYLIVAVNADESVRKLKGQNRPINHLEHRMKVLAGFDAVDWVIPFKDETPERLLKLIHPDVLAKGGDYTIDQVVGADIVRAYGGLVRIVTHDITTSSSSILEQLNTSTIEE